MRKIKGKGYKQSPESKEGRNMQKPESRTEHTCSSEIQKKVYAREKKSRRRLNKGQNKLMLMNRGFGKCLGIFRTANLKEQERL